MCHMTEANVQVFLLTKQTKAKNFFLEKQHITCIYSYITKTYARKRIEKPNCERKVEPRQTTRFNHKNVRLFTHHITRGTKNRRHKSLYGGANNLILRLSFTYRYRRYCPLSFLVSTNLKEVPSFISPCSNTNLSWQRPLRSAPC